jgi:ornithine decarboxylase
MPFVIVMIEIQLISMQLGFNNMGAYTICAASQFNGFEVSKVIYTAGPEVRLVLSQFAADGYGI